MTPVRRDAAPGGAGRRVPRVVLAPFSAADAAEFAQAVAASRKLHHPWVQPPGDAAQAVQLALRRQGPADFGFLVRDAASGQLAGYVEITNIVRGCFLSGYLAYYAFQGCQRRGYLAAGLRLVLRQAWKQLGLHRLEANIRPDNAASIALVKSLGFVQEGYSRRYLKLGGRWRDHERWAILAD